MSWDESPICLNELPLMARGVTRIDERWHEAALHQKYGDFEARQ